MSDYAVVISSRMGSIRLPGKALARYVPKRDITNLEQIIMRWRKSRRDPVLIGLTTAGHDDDVIEEIFTKNGIPCHRGGIVDVVSGIDGSLTKYAPDAKYVARALGDNPLVDVSVADWKHDILAETGADSMWYGGDDTRITYAGTTDVFSRAAWARISTESVGIEREHPGLYFWRNLSRFSVVQLPLPFREFLMPFRTELDEARDLEMFRAVWRVYTDEYNCNSHQNADLIAMPTMDALEILMRYPDIAAINAEVELKTQSEPEWKKGMHFGCKVCHHRIGAIVAGDLEVRCPRCGRAQKFYSSQPPNPYRKLKQTF